MLKTYQEKKDAVLQMLNALASSAQDLGMQSLSDDITKTRLPKLVEGRFNLVVLGEFNHGKSTFVNALLGKPLLPMGITPTTATINHIVYGDESNAKVVYFDGKEEVFSPQELADYVTLEGEHAADNIRYVEVSYPSEMLRDRITLVDTPGVNDINQARADVTYSYIPRADAVIFLLDSTQVLKQSERAFIQRRLLKRNRDKLIFVLGKIDLIDEDERKEAFAFAEQHLTSLVPDPQIFSLSARRYLEKQEDAGQMKEFLDYLQNYLHQERGRILVDNAISDAKRTIGYLNSSIGIKRGSLALTAEELSERIEKVQKQLAGSKANLDEISNRISHEASAIKATIKHDLRLFADRFCETLPLQIDAVDSNDVKRYLQLFIQDKFKEWAEIEGDKVGELLEHLAEEIIQVANESIHSTLDAIASKLGASDTRIELKVDTLGYDASVFAIGALGTTIFLFVNTFVGGLLTLAAPLLAVVFKEKVGGQIKKQAKELAPQAIERAADAMGPQFEKVVDRFCDQLHDFIASAGAALHQGISEVLDHTLKERHTHQLDAERVTTSLNEAETNLENIDQNLDQLRADLWQEMD